MDSVSELIRAAIAYRDAHTKWREAYAALTAEECADIGATNAVADAAQAAAIDARIALTTAARAMP